ncbi:unnamed protein product, partial [marine sediment metagenome]
LKRKIPVNTFDSTTYTDIASKKIGNGIPIGYGIIQGAMAVCVNDEEVAPSEYNFVFVDTSLHEIESINQVYVNGEEVSHSNGSTANGTFDISTSDYKKNNKVTVDYNGYIDGDTNLIENPMDIIADLLLIYDGKAFIDDYFDTTTWDSVKIGLADTALSIAKPIVLIKAIIMLTRSFFGTFKLNGEGKFTMLILDLTAEVSKLIGNHELLQLAKKKNDDESYMSSVSVGYNQEWESKESPKYINTDDEEILTGRYRNYEQKDFMTTLIAESD